MTSPCSSPGYRTLKVITPHSGGVGGMYGRRMKASHKLISSMNLSFCLLDIARETDLSVGLGTLCLGFSIEQLVNALRCVSRRESQISSSLIRKSQTEMRSLGSRNATKLEFRWRAMSSAQLVLRYLPPSQCSCYMLWLTLRNASELS